MLLLAHTGITLGLVRLAFARKSVAANLAAAPDRPGSQEASTARSFKVDYRLVFMGSMLPDIVDKPLGIFFFAEQLANGRVFGHTLVFALALWASGLYLHRKHCSPWALLLAFGSTIHLFLDEMWLQPQTIFWPLLGWSFPREGVAGWLGKMVLEMVTDARVFVPELIGALILVEFAGRIWKQRRLVTFLRSGWLP